MKVYIVYKRHGYLTDTCFVTSKEDLAKEYCYMKVKAHDFNRGMT